MSYSWGPCSVPCLAPYQVRSCSILDLVVSWLRSGSILVLFLGLLGLRGLGLFLSLGVIFWFQFRSGPNSVLVLVLFLVLQSYSGPWGLCSGSVCVLVLVPYWVCSYSVLNPILQFCPGPQFLQIYLSSFLGRKGGWT